MTTHDSEKRSRVARDFRRVLIVLVIIFVAILGRQEYKIHQIQKETDATRKRVEELQKVQADLEAERKRLSDPKYIEKLTKKRIRTPKKTRTQRRERMKKRLKISIHIDTGYFLVVKLYSRIFRAGGFFVLWQLKLELS